MYRNIRAMMARYDMTVKELSDIVSVSQTTMSVKLNGHVGFTLSEAKKILSHFNDMGEKCTVENLFFENVSVIKD